MIKFSKNDLLILNCLEKHPLASAKEIQYHTELPSRTVYSLLLGISGSGLANRTMSEPDNSSGRPVVKYALSKLGVSVLQSAREKEQERRIEMDAILT